MRPHDSDKTREATLRAPAVAGRFYPRDREELLAEVRSFVPHRKPSPLLGCVVPHAGYMYSGPVAGAVYATAEVPAKCIILCPNHTGMGQPLAIMSHGAWDTPLGSAPIDSELAGALKNRCSLLREDAEAHKTEHATEVQLPFLQVVRPDFTFVPIALGTSNFEALTELGAAIAQSISAQEGQVLIIASSDMNHYESDAVTRVKDRKAIMQMEAMNPRGLFDVVMNEAITMCGFGPAVVMMTAAKRLGATSGELVKYATSGDVSGDRGMVVGYAGMVVR